MQTNTDVVFPEPKNQTASFHLQDGIRFNQFSVRKLLSALLREHVQPRSDHNPMELKTCSGYETKMDVILTSSPSSVLILLYRVPKELYIICH